MTTYIRPISLLFGPDARHAVAERRAGPLGGSLSVAFGAIEITQREGGSTTRRTTLYSEKLAAIEQPRPPLCGLALDRPKIMGIINVTPDSFSDGGRLPDSAAAIAHGMRLAEEGADLLDVGGESTRPGSDPVSIEEEWSRIGGVIASLAKAGQIVSVDTRKSEIMKRAADAGARIVNDVSALAFDLRSLAIIASLNMPAILMHAQGDPKTMQANPTYEDVALDVYDALKARIEACAVAGIAPANILIDPGIGFGKTARHNLDLMHRLTLLHGLGVPVVFGLSRKSTVGLLTGEALAADRVMGSVGGAVQAALMGVQILRVHDVKGTRQALEVALAIADPDESGINPLGRGSGIKPNQ